MTLPGMTEIRKTANHLHRLLLRDIGRGPLLIVALVMVLSGAAVFRVANDNKNKIVPAQITQKADTDNTDAPAESESGAPEAETETPAEPTKPTSSRSAVGSSKMEINVDIPRTTFRVGEDSGEITVQTSNGAAVNWWFSVEPNDPVSVRVEYIHAPGNSPSAKIKLVTGNPSLAKPGTYTFTVKAFKSLDSILATKSVTITLQPVIPFTFDIEDEYLTYDEDTGEVCAPYSITALPHLNLMNINVTAQIVAGDTTGMYISVHPPSSYYAGNKICIGLTGPAALGPRTIRATATAYDYTTTDDLKLEVVEVVE